MSVVTASREGRERREPPCAQFSEPAFLLGRTPHCGLLTAQIMASQASNLKSLCKRRTTSGALTKEMQITSPCFLQHAGLCVSHTWSMALALCHHAIALGMTGRLGPYLGRQLWTQGMRCCRPTAGGATSGCSCSRWGPGRWTRSVWTEGKGEKRYWNHQTSLLLPWGRPSSLPASTDKYGVCFQTLLWRINSHLQFIFLCKPRHYRHFTVIILCLKMYIFDFKIWLRVTNHPIYPELKGFSRCRPLSPRPGTGGDPIVGRRERSYFCMVCVTSRHQHQYL